MVPQVEQLEDRNCPALPWHTVPFYGADLVVVDYPVAPMGMQVLAMQDEVNDMPLLMPVYHPTPLMPVPHVVSIGDLTAFFSQPIEWQEFEQEVDEAICSGGDAYAFVPQDEWQALQDVIYQVGVAQPSEFWSSWVANVQSQVAEANTALFAAQDAYWSSVNMGESFDFVDSLVVSILQEQERA